MVCSGGHALDAMTRNAPPVPFDQTVSRVRHARRHESVMSQANRWARPQQPATAPVVSPAAGLVTLKRNAAPGRSYGMACAPPEHGTVGPVAVWSPNTLPAPGGYLIPGRSMLFRSSGYGRSTLQRRARAVWV